MQDTHFKGTLMTQDTLVTNLFWDRMNLEGSCSQKTANFRWPVIVPPPSGLRVVTIWLSAEHKYVTPGRRVRDYIRL